MSIFSGCSCGNRRANAFDSLSLDVWDPFKRALTTSSPRTAFSNETTAFVKTQIDLKETPEAHVFKAEVPGLKKHEVNVKIEKGRILQISGERSIEKEEENDKYRCFETSSGKFIRRFSLPDNAKVDQVKFTLENGVLTVIVPKATESGVKVIPICT